MWFYRFPGNNWTPVIFPLKLLLESEVCRVSNVLQMRKQPFNLQTSLSWQPNNWLPSHQGCPRLEDEKEIAVNWFSFSHLYVYPVEKRNFQVICQTRRRELFENVVKHCLSVWYIFSIKTKTKDIQSILRVMISFV